ncbi:MAG: hypothetical protein CLLPBCKN_006354 [Chroococcidiopsis cubana SAG 39.79]|nr:hypothetical protein [Chroococcidiopsis cubana SAG 39.79]
MTAVAIDLVRVVAWLRGIPHAKPEPHDLLP